MAKHLIYIVVIFKTKNSMPNFKSFTALSKAMAYARIYRTKYPTAKISLKRSSIG